MPVDRLEVEWPNPEEDYWRIVNQFGAELFAGTKQQVETWLDHQENQER